MLLAINSTIQQNQLTPQLHPYSIVVGDLQGQKYFRRGCLRRVNLKFMPILLKVSTIL